MSEILPLHYSDIHFVNRAKKVRDISS